MARRRRKVGRSRVRLWGAPEPVRFTATEQGKALAEAAPIHFSRRRDQDRLLALEKLALDVFNNPLAARAFSANPQEYLAQGGFRDVKLDLNSQEVRIVMALGDPAVKEAARKGDVDAFLAAMVAQGIKPSIGAPMALFGVELAVWFTAVAISWVAAAYTVETAVTLHHKIGVAGVGVLTVESHVDQITRLAKRLGDPEFVRKVQSTRMRRIIEQYVELHRKARGLDG